MSCSHPRDFNLFRTLKKNLAVKGFATEANVKQALTSEFLTLYNDLFSIPGRNFVANVVSA